MLRILLLEDDEALALGIQFTLQDEGYEVIHVGTVTECKQVDQLDTFDVAILDVKLPDGSGYDACRYIKQNSKMPIIFLTALDDEVNIVLGLELGADDYISKPFRVRELIARIKAVLRRYSNKVDDTTVLKSGDITLDLFKALLRKEDKEVQLTTQEYRLLLIFLNHPEIILSRDFLMEKLLAGQVNFIDDNTLAVYIKRLREKVEDDPSVPTYIVTQRGMGYRWAKKVFKG